MFSGLSLAPTDNVQSVVGTCYLFPLPGILYDPPMLILRGCIASAATWRGSAAATWHQLGTRSLRASFPLRGGFTDDDEMIT